MTRRGPTRSPLAALLPVLPLLALPVLLGAPPAAARELPTAWYLDAMHAGRAHRLTQGEGVTVAVVGTGVDARHPALAGRVLPGATVGADGVVNPAVRGDRDPDGHGTAMAGLIAGSGTGISGLGGDLGIAPRARILPVRIANGPGGTMPPGHVYAGVRWAIDQGVDVVSLSLSGNPTADAPWKEELVTYAIEHGTVLVAAAGNRTAVEVRVGEPASIPGVIAVSGLAEDGSVWSGSVTGGPVVLSAPAEDLPHLTRDGGCDAASGTSGAAALVAGVAGLIRSRYPDASAADVVNRLIRTARDEGSPGRDPGFGFGAVDAYAALVAAVAPSDRYPLDLPDTADGGDDSRADGPGSGGTPGWLWPALAGTTAVAAAGFAAVRREHRRPPGRRRASR